MEKHKVAGMVTWASRIQDLRAEGMTLAQLGEQVGLSVPSVLDLEKGRTKSPRGDAAMRLQALHKARARNAKRARATA